MAASQGCGAEDTPGFRIPPPDFLADAGLRAVLGALPGARLVGGCVRDAIAGASVADLDLATPLPPEQVVHALQRAGLRAVPTGLAHGTVTAVSNGRGYEVTTLRRDVETDGRHAQVAWTDDWREDAARRDFTINAMSMQPDGWVFDYFDGAADLRAGRVRFVGDPAARIAEDRLRALRYFRFYARYARSPPDAATLGALRDAAPELHRLSAERVWSELKRILATPDPRGAVALMAETGLLAAAVPEGSASGSVDGLARLARLVDSGAPPDPMLRLAALLPEPDASDAAEALAARLKLSGAERDALAALLQARTPHPASDDAALRRLRLDRPLPALVGRTWLDGGAGPDWDALRARLQATPQPRFPLEGRDALALGMQPGPQVGQALAAVRAWWVEGGCTAGYDACRAELARRIRA